MSDGDALLAAIRAVPLDDTPKLVYADWLDEHDRAEMAFYVREMVALAREEHRTSPDFFRRTREQRLRGATLDAAWLDAMHGRAAVAEVPPAPPAAPPRHPAVEWLTVATEICEYLKRE